MAKPATNRDVIKREEPGPPMEVKHTALDDIREQCQRYGAPTWIEQAPQTKEFALPVGLEKYIENPGLPRATRAITKEKPHGSADSRDDRTVMQQHVDFWDEDKDGIIWPIDTYKGFRKLGAPFWMSFLAPFVVHGGLSFPTWPTWFPDPFWRIWVNNIHKAKHGSDTAVYDTEGRFVPEKFEEIYSKHDKDDKGGLTFWETLRLVRTNACPMDFFGITAEFLEHSVSWYLYANEKGYLPKEKLRGIYDGTAFYHRAALIEQKEEELKKA